jgi:hypothetical protein
MPGVYLHLVAWKGVRKDTKRSYSDCLLEISQNASRKKILQMPVNDSK